MGIFLQKDRFTRQEEARVKDERGRRIIVAASSDTKAAPGIAAKQLRISHAIARDFADAVAAYSRLSETLVPKVELVELETWPGTTQQTEPFSLVLVCPLSADGTYACAPIEAIGTIVQDLPQPNVPLVYVVAYSDAASGETERQALTALHHSIERLGANWGGALLLGGADTFEHLYRLPRLGAHRRPISQAIDLLVCAARLDKPLEKAMRSIGHEDPRGLVCAQPGLSSILHLHQAICHR